MSKKNINLLEENICNSKYMEKMFANDVLNNSSIDNNQDNDKKIEKALEIALDIRKHEVQTMWSRIAQFWIIITLLFLGYGSLLAFFIKNKSIFEDNNDAISIIILSIFNIVTFMSIYIWKLVIETSSYWVSQWEWHVMNLQFKKMGNIYNTIHKNNNVYSLNKLVIFISLMLLTLIFLAEFLTLFFYNSEVSPCFNFLFFILYCGILYALSIYVQNKCKSGWHKSNGEMQ